MSSKLLRLSLPNDTVNQLLAHNKWVTFAPKREGLINWRHLVAMRMRHVEIAPFVPTVKRLLTEMAQDNNGQVLDEWPPVDDFRAVLEFSDWLSRWIDRFCGWHDPIRSMCHILCQKAQGDALEVSEVLDLADGVVWCDYVLEIVCQFQLYWGAVTWPSPHEEHLRDALFERGPGRETAPAFTLFALEQYEMFRWTAHFKTAPAPCNPDIGINFDNLFDCSMWERANDAA